MHVHWVLPHRLRSAGSVPITVRRPNFCPDNEIHLGIGITQNKKPPRPGLSVTSHKERTHRTQRQIFGMQSKPLSRAHDSPARSAVNNAKVVGQFPRRYGVDEFNCWFCHSFLRFVLPNTAPTDRVKCPRTNFVSLGTEKRSKSILGHVLLHGGPIWLAWSGLFWALPGLSDKKPLRTALGHPQPGVNRRNPGRLGFAKRIPGDSAP